MTSGKGGKKKSPPRSKSTPRPAARAVPAEPKAGAAEASGGAPTIIVGIGASAGGLKPLQTILADLPTGRGLAIAIVQHMGAGSDAVLASLIAKATRYKVVAAADGMPIAADSVYIMPAEKSMSVLDGRLSVQDVAQCQGLRMPIDHFFCTLAVAQGRRAVGIVLSGTGIDGTHGLAEIKALGGTTAAQDPPSAEFPEMPQTAVSAGCADAVLPPEKMPEMLLRRADEQASLTAQQEEEADLEEILAAVRSATGHDFHCYKRGTLDRRIGRRMGMLRVGAYSEYARVLRSDKDEAAALRKDLLIGVTEFFRQPEAWHVLEEKVVAELVAGAKARSTLRAWVPACASGKEAYSLAILLAENIERSGKKLGIQVFATDADASAVETARAGVYSEEELKGISNARLRRYFTRKNGRYEVVKELRGVIIFAPQDLTSDPPFSKLDLVSCRNLLIYLDQSVQKKIIQLFHFSLRERGCLFLGSAENISGQENLFAPLSQKWRIYRKLGVATPVGLDLPLRPAGKPALAIPPASPPRPTLPAITLQALAERFGPPAAVVDRKGALLYVHGAVDGYLQMSAGEQTGLLADVAREGLRNRLSTALFQAVAENKKVSVLARVKRDKKAVAVKITVNPLRRPREADGLLLVTFEEPKLPKAALAPAEGGAPHSDLRQLEDELKITREELSSTIGQLEQSNEHLKASNEEVTSANEELQSANEELETSKEELQSLNEELNAVNTRLQEKVVELEHAGDDVTNLLTSGDVATIFLDRQLRVRRFTPAVTRLLGLVESDLGRPIADIHRKFQDDALLADARRVLVDLSPASAEVLAENGDWYQRRILPYRTKDDRIEGVAVTFADVTDLKQLAEALRCSEETVRQSEARYRQLVQDANSAIIRWKRDGTLTFFNEYAESFFGYAAAEVIGKNVSILVPPHDTAGSDLTTLAQDIVTNPGKYVDNVNENVCRDGRRVWMAWTNKPILDAAGQVAEILAIGMDITDRRRAEEEIRRAREQWELTFDSVPDLIAILDDKHHVVRANRAMADRLGLTPQQCAGAACFQAVHGTKCPPDFCPHAQTLADGKPHTAEVHEPRLGGDYLVTTTPLLDAHGKMTGAVHVARDITEHKRAQHERDTAVEFLRIINSAGDTAGLVHAAATFFHEKSGCQAVGIRLKDGDDYPYYEARGFPEKFLQVENHLCSRDAAGQIARDAAGDPLLECMCGNIIQGRFDPSKPFFTGGGSFWTNCTTELLASTTEADRQARTRNRCNGEGYESVALVPLRAGQEALGLLQLNDKRKGMFSAQAIALWERLAGYLAVALAKTRAEEALRRSEEDYRRVVETANEGIWISDAQRKTLFVNQRMADMLGCTREEMIGQLGSLFLDPGQESVSQETRAQLSAGVPTRREFRFRRKDGSILWAISSSMPTLDASGNHTGTVSMLTDITERKLAEEALAESRERLELALRSARMATFDWDIVQDKRTWSEGVHRLLGTTPETFTGTPEEFFKVIHPQDRDAVRAALAWAVETNALYESEYRAVWPDGSIRHIAARGLVHRDGAGRPVRMTGICWDITQRKEAESVLRNTLQRFYTVLSSMYSGVLLVTDDGRVEFANQAFCDRFGLAESPAQLAGYSSGEFIEKIKISYLHPDEAVHRIREVLQQGQPVKGEEVAMRDGGTCLRDFVPLNVHGQSVGRLWLHLDITERKRAEEDLRLSEEKFSRAFAGNAAAIAMTRLEDGMFLEVNDTWLAMNGYSREETIGSSARQMRIWPDAEASRRFVEELQEKGSVRGWEQEFRRKTGEPFVAQLSAQIMTVRGQQVILSTLVDITERKRAEDGLHRFNRTLKALGRSSQALVRAGDEKAYLDEVCRIIVEDCGHAMVWVGYADDDEGRSVRPVAWSGFEEGYLETLQITWADTDRGRGPTGTAIRTGKPAFCRNMQTDPLFAPWREQAVKRGYASSLVLPLLSEGKTLGALTIYFCEPDPFAPDEVALLTELAGDLAMGITTIRTRAARQRAEDALREAKEQLELRVVERTAELTEAFQALRRASSYTRSLIEASVDPLVTIGPDGTITDVNAATEAATGLTRRELVGTDFSTYFTEPDKARAGYRHVFQEGSVRDYPLEIRGRDGHTTPVLYNAALYRDEAEQVVGVFAAARDITKRREAEAELQRINETLEQRVAERTSELERSNEELSQFAHVASHDLQEPLRMVGGFLKLLEERYKPQLDAKAQEYIGYSVEGAARMSQLITDLLAYSRVGRQAVELRPSDAGEALATALANLRGSVVEAGAEVTHDDLPTVLADPTQLMQLLQNLLGNAIKFRSPGRPCRVHVGAEQKEGRWVLSVRDNGIGIDPRQRERVFIIFQRLHTREKYPGTGIGLAICKKIVERHGGRIWVESKPGEGSTFFFTLPA